MGSVVLGEAIGAIRDWSITKGKKGKAPAALPTNGSNGFGSVSNHKARMIRRVSQTRLFPANTIE